MINAKAYIYLLILLISTVTLSMSQVPQSHQTFESFDGTSIAYAIEGQGPAVVLIHGFINDGGSWSRAQIKQSLIDHGYQVIIPDMRGNGYSDKPQNPEKYQNDAEIKDLKSLADHLFLDSYHAIGYSRGSILLAKLLTQDKRITKAVIGGMGIDFSNPDWPRRIAFADAFMGRQELNEMTQGAVSYATSIHADLKILGMLQDYQPVTTIEELNTISTSLLIVCGDQDLDNGDPKALHQQLKNSQLIIVKGDHNNTYKQNNFAQAVIEFLSD